VSAAVAQQAAVLNALANPPLFQGIVMDAKGKTVGRISFNSGSSFDNHTSVVIRQIDGIWIALPVTDIISGFSTTRATDLIYWYQTKDCTGQPYMSANGPNPQIVSAPPVATVTTVPPATAPSIYFAGTPTGMVTVNSTRYAPVGSTCDPLGPDNQGPFTSYMGPVQSVPVSSLGLTLPFKIE
jgi:hypothetical protein